MRGPYWMGAQQSKTGFVFALVRCCSPGLPSGRRSKSQYDCECTLAGRTGVKKMFRV